MCKVVQGTMQRQYRSRVLFYLTAVILLAGVGCLVAGIVLMVRARRGSEDAKTTPVEARPSARNPYSQEARRIGLDKLLGKVKDTYIELYPNRIAFDGGATSEEIKSKYRPYDPTPSIIKNRTDASRELLEELETLEFSSNKLKQFEKRALAQAKYWVYHVFAYGVPYGYDYYNGDWLLGPDLFHWDPVFHTDLEMKRTFVHFKPESAADVELLGDRLRELGKGLKRYKANLQLGIESGMVRNIESCVSGLRAFKSKFLTISLGGETGVLNASFVQPLLKSEFLEDFVKNETRTKEWEAKYKSSVNDSLKEFLVVNVGRPLHDIIRYLEFNYTFHCVSSNISSGMATLPLKHMYVNDTPIGPTRMKLPTGERLNGMRAYAKLLSYFTTTDITPDEVHELGKSVVQDLYDEVIHLAKEVSGEKNNHTAKTKVLELLHAPENYFNDEPIPANESDSNAHATCSTREAARIHCPVRWKAMMNWFDYIRQLSTLLNTKILDLFHMVGSMTSVPSCPVKTTIDFNPAASAPTYHQTDGACTNVAQYRIPFFKEKPGPRSDEWTTTAHEVQPGHHLQVQGFNENFASEDHSEVSEWLSTNLYFLAFSEGWALYSEDPLIAKQTDVYEEYPLMKFGAIKWQMVRGMRLVLDTGLHAKGMTREQALRIFRHYSWETKNISEKEITRYQSVPGQGISYFYGKKQIMDLREDAKKRLGNKFKIKDFHFHVLRHGSSPLPYLKEAINTYVNCVLNSEIEGCAEVLRPGPASGRITRVHAHLPMASFYVR